MSGPDYRADEIDADEMRERIAAELAALGEDPLEDASEDEALAFAMGDAPDIDVATVQTLAGWAEPPLDDVELSELAQARVWRTIELRSKSTDVQAEPSTSRGARPLILGAVVAMLAVAAGVLLVPVLTSSTPELAAPVAKAPSAAAPSITAEELDVLSTRARASLAALDRLSGEPRGSARAQAMAADYARRLEAEG